MINFRFHIVSIIAVFLALTIGIVMGATVIDQGIVDRLNDRITTVSNRAEERRRANEALTADVGRLNEFVGEAQPFVVQDRLTAVPVVVIAVRGVDPATVEAQVELLRAADAVAPGIIWLEESWALKGDDAGRMADALGESNGRRATVAAAAWTALAERLAAGQAGSIEGLDAAGGEADAATSADLLATLSEAGFLQIETVGQEPIELAGFPGRGARVVLLTGTGAAITRGELVRLGARSLEAAGVPTVVGEIYGSGDTARGSTLEPVRANDLATSVSTVDDVEIPEGRMAVVLAVDDLGHDPPVTGDYGYGDGAQSPLPTFRALP